MPRKLIPEAAQLAPLPFPLQGIDISAAFGAQRPFTTPLGVNVRTYEALTMRGRGGARPGLAKYIVGQVPAGSTLIQELQPMTVVNPNSTVQTIAFGQTNSKGYANGVTDYGYVQSATAGYVATTTVTVVLTGVVKDNVMMLFAVNDFDGVSGGVLPTDNLSSTWQLLHADNSTSNYNCAGYYATVPNDGDVTISLTGFGGAHNWRLVAVEYTGLNLTGSLVTGPLDQAANGTFGASPLTYTPSATSTNELAVGYVGNKFGNHAFTTSDAYTTRQNLNGSAADGCPLRVMDHISVNHLSEPQAEATFSATDSVMNVFTFFSGGANTGRSIAYNSNVTIGNLLIFGVTTTDSNSLPVTVSDTVGTVWLLAASTTLVSGLGTWYGRLYYGAAGATGANTVSITSTTSAPVGLAVLEYSNVARIGQLDGVNSTSTAGGPSVRTGSVPVNSDLELLVAMFGQAEGNYSFTADPTPSPGFVLRTHVNDGTTDTAIYIEDYIGTSGALVAHGTLSGGTHGALSIGASFIASGASLEPSGSGRESVLVSVAGGNIQSAQAGASIWTPAINSTGKSPPLFFVQGDQIIVRSAQNGNYLYFADGVNYVRFNPLTNIAEPWTASAGSLPIDANNNTPRLIATCWGRTVLAGLYLQPFDIFASQVGDPTNFDYAPANPAPSDAFKLSVTPLGQMQDVVTALIPYTQDVMVVGCASSIWLLQGDPGALSSTIQRVSDVMGMAWGIAWCKDPYGTLYFCSNRMAIHTMVPGQQPVRLSQQIAQDLLPIDTGANTIRLIWDDVFQGIHLFITSTGAIAPETHWFWEMRSGSWFQQVLANNNYNPQCCCIFDGNTAGDRLVLIGSWDGYVRAFLPTATTDDGTPFTSQVLLGPILTENLDEMLLKDAVCNLGEGSSTVTYDVLVGTTAEAAISSGTVATGTWRAGRNVNAMLRRSAHCLWVRITSTGQWAMDQVSVRLTSKGKVRRRSKTG